MKEKTKKIRMARIGVLVGLLLVLTWGQATASTSTSNLFFNTSEQNPWGSGASSPLSQEKCLCLTWGNPYPKDYYKYFDLDPAGDVWAASSGNVGLDFKLSGSAGSMALKYPMQVNLSYPDPGSLFVGSTFTIGSSFSGLASGFGVQTPYFDATGAHYTTFNTGGPNLQTRGPGIYASLDAIANVKAIAGGHLFGIDLPTVGPNMHESYSILKVDPAQGANIDLIPNIVSGYARSPNLNTQSGGLAGNDLYSSMRDTLGGINLNITNLITQVLGGPPLEGRVAGVYYNLIKVGAGLYADLQQSFSFLPKPTIHLDFTSPVDVFSSGTWNKGMSSVEFLAGDSISVKAPKSYDLGIIPSILLDNSTTNTTDAILGGQLGMSALGFDLPVIGEVGPLIHPDPVKFDLASFNAYSNSFKLNTGPAVTANPFNIQFKDLLAPMTAATTGICALAPNLPQCAGVSVNDPERAINICTANPTLSECQGVDWTIREIDPCVLDPLMCASFNYRIRIPDTLPESCFDPNVDYSVPCFYTPPQIYLVNGDCNSDDPLLCAAHDLIGAASDGAWNDTHSAWVFANNGFPQWDELVLADPSTDQKAQQRFASLGYDPSDYLITMPAHSVPEPGTALLVLAGIGLLGLAGLKKRFEK